MAKEYQHSCRGYASPACVYELLKRVEALEAANRLHVFTAEEVSPVVVPAQNALLDAVTEAIKLNHRCDGFRGDARAAIRAVAAYNLGRSHSTIPADFDPEQARSLASLLEREASHYEELNHTICIDDTELRAAADLLRTLAPDGAKPPVSTLTIAGKWGDVTHPDRIVANGKVYEAMR